jgi:hypothetical protein
VAHYVRELALRSKLVPDHPVSKEKDDILSLFKTFDRLMHFSSNISAIVPDILEVCVAHWSQLTSLWLRPTTVPGDVLLHLPHLIHLGVGDVLFTPTTTPLPPPPFHLLSLDLVHYSFRHDLEYLLSSSHTTLTELSLDDMPNEQAPDLSALANLEDLTLSCNNGEDEEPDIYAEVDSLKRTLGSTTSSKLKVLTLGAWDCAPVDGLV